MKARALRRGLVTGLIAPEQTTRLTGGIDLFLQNFSKNQKSFSQHPIFYPLSVVTSGRVFFSSTQNPLRNSTQTRNKSQPNIEKPKERKSEKFTHFEKVSKNFVQNAFFVGYQLRGLFYKKIINLNFFEFSL